MKKKVLCCRKVQTEWADQWQMEFNPEKCEMMHFERSNKTREHAMNGRTLGSSEEQMDLGVLVHRSLKAAGQVNRIVKKADWTPAFISCGIDHKQGCYDGAVQNFGWATARVLCAALVTSF